MLGGFTFILSDFPFLNDGSALISISGDSPCISKLYSGDSMSTLGCLISTVGGLIFTFASGFLTPGISPDKL